MLDKTSDISIAAENWLAQFETALGAPGGGELKSLFVPDSYWRDALALSWTLQTINGRDAILEGLRALAPGAALANLADRSRSRRAAQGDARGHRLHRSDLQIRDRYRPRQRHPAPDPGCRRRQPAEGLDAADRARGTEGLRGAARRIAADAARPIRAIFAAPTGSTCARPRPICRSRSGRAGGRRRTGRTFDRRAAQAVAASTR